MLTFRNLREANVMRLPEFNNARGKPAHTKPDGSDWHPAQWLQALVGELGEYANFRKKYERGDITHEEFCKQARKELADVACYLDLLARRCLDYRDGTPHPEGIELDKAVIAKFNEISDRVSARTHIHPDGEPYMDFTGTDV